MKDKVFSTYDVAKICNVHHTTVINWVKAEKLKAYTTPGGHRRITKDGLIEFMSKYNIPIPKDMLKAKDTILIVDDDGEALDELGSALECEELALDFASDGFEAARKIYLNHPDLILLDFRMPGMNGFQVCDFLKKDEDTSNIPIIAVTVLTSDDDIKRIKESGVSGYINKPVDVENLKKMISDILDIKF